MFFDATTFIWREGFYYLLGMVIDQWYENYLGTNNGSTIGDHIFAICMSH